MNIAWIDFDHNSSTTQPLMTQDRQDEYNWHESVPPKRRFDAIDTEPNQIKVLVIKFVLIVRQFP